MIETKWTALSAVVPPLVWAAQVVPPSVVATMTPASPTAQPWVRSAKETPRRWLVVPLVCATQLAPASSVRKIAPPLPTAQPVPAVTKSTALSTTPPGTTPALRHVTPRSSLRATEPALPTAQAVTPTKSRPQRSS